MRAERKTKGLIFTGAACALLAVAVFLAVAGYRHNLPHILPAPAAVTDAAHYDADELSAALAETYSLGSLIYQPAPDAPGLHVLFFGNSYTYINDVPRLVAYIAASDSENHTPVQTGVVAIGGATLDQLWHVKATQRVLHAQHWDYVVLQEHSMEATVAEWIPVMQTAMAKWNAAIRAAGAKPVIYETWARKPGSDWYETARHPEFNFGSPEKMQLRVDMVTNAIAAQIDAPVVAAGDYWAACSAQSGAPMFWHTDGTHGSLAGSYLNALLIYRQLIGHKPEHVAFSPPALNSKVVEFIKKCASY